MSFDLKVGVQVAGLPADKPPLYVCIATPEFDQPTYNLATLFRRCTGWDFVQGTWYRASEVINLICNGIFELVYKPDVYKPFLPANGWGTIKSALDSLKSWRDTIYETAEDKEIPLDALWVRW